ncbi:DUF1631 family protein [Ramlibacter rhizophilus]|uniref:DUF1631 family protein n=1 Tax=Ramlibacter rhizophilus TaxID=1781167 RepID=A0A4Z0BFL7_9BURK|nr:DUF1631 family protein [Ramlibacter rhizophilus]TFY98102.1 DUF1631 family protein [Ramlibacter rhizophilus]
MSQASLLSSDGFRRLIGRAPVVPRLETVRSLLPSSGLSTGTDWEAAANDALVQDAMRFAEQRRATAEQLVIELVQRPDLREAPEPVQDFLLQVWPLVLAHARLTSPTPEHDPGAFMALVPRLLWSVRRDSILRRPGRLVAMIPELLGRLREGLALIGREPAACRTFFRALEALHRPALQLCASRRQNQLFFAPDPQDSLLEGPPAPHPLLRLRAGRYLFLYSGGRWQKVRLDWVDPRGRQFMFSGEQGDAHAMTRRILSRLLAEDLIRFDDPRPHLCA